MILKILFWFLTGILAQRIVALVRWCRRNPIRVTPTLTAFERGRYKRPI